MNLFLFRHGLAVDREDWKNEDAERPLVEKGRERTLIMAKALCEWVDDVDLIVTSPYKRAKQTADILKTTFKSKKVLESVELVPSAPPSAFAQWLKINAPHAHNVIAVGHEPQLGLLATWLLSGQTETFVTLKKSGVVALDVESFVDLGPRGAHLRFMIHPKMV